MNDLNRRWFKAKDIYAKLGITANQLFHWSKGWGLFIPDIKADGRQGKDRYSLSSLMSLFLIKHLAYFGIDLKSIKGILETTINALQEEQPKFKPKNINSLWEFFKRYRKEYSEKGLVILIDQTRFEDALLFHSETKRISKPRSKFAVSLLSGESAITQLSEDVLDPGFAGGRVYFGTIIVNVKAIALYIEHLMGEQL